MKKVHFSTFRVHSAPPAVDRMPSTEYPASPPPSYEEVQLSICHTITTIRVFLVFSSGVEAAPWASSLL